MPYVNATDSSAGFQDDENLVLEFDEGTPRVPPVKDDEGNVTVEAVPATGGTCRCGCGADVPAGSLYKPGHDARLKGKLTRAFLAGVEVTLRTGGTQTTSTVESLAASGFGPKGTQEALVKATERVTAAQRTAEQRKAERDAKAEARKAEATERKAKADAAKAEAKAAKDAAKAAEGNGDGTDEDAPKAAKGGRRVA